MKRTIHDLAIAVVLAAALGAAGRVEAASTTNDTPVTQASDLTLTVVSGDTLTYSGKITLTGGAKLIKSGEGTLILTNPENTMEGGVELTRGKLTAGAAGCFGSGKIVLSGTQERQLIFNASGATFANDIEQTEYYDFNWAYARCHIRVESPVTLSGNIVSRCGHLSLDTHNATTASATFTGLIDTGDYDFGLSQVGTVYLNCPVKCSALKVSFDGWWDRGVGHVYISSTENSIRQIWELGGDVWPTVPNAFSGAELYHHGRLNAVGRSRFDLGGNSQTIAAIDATAPYDKHNFQFGENPSSGTINSSSPATLTITGGVTYAGSTVATCRFLIKDAISIVLDAPGLTQTFMERKNTTTGTIDIRRGTFRATDMVGFANVPSITVASGAALETAITNGTVFSGCTSCTVNGSLTVENGTIYPFFQSVNLTLGAGASVTLPEGTMVYVASLTIDGEAKGPGVYRSANTSNIIRSGVIVVGGGSLQTWTGGGGADTGIATVANWGGSAADVEFATVPLTFASGGTAATVDRACRFGDTTLSAANGFSFLKGSDSASVEIVGSLAVQKDAADEGVVRRYAFEPLVTIDTETPQTLSVPTNDTLVLAGGLNFPNAAARLSKAGAGTLELREGTVINRHFAVLGGSLVLKGLIATPEHVDQGKAGASENGASICVNNFDNGNSGLIVLDGATIEKPFYIRAKNSTTPIVTSVAGSTNVFKGHVSIPSPTMQIFANGADGVMRFEGGIDATWSIGAAGGGTFEFRDHDVRTNNFCIFRVKDNTRVVFAGTHNWVGVRDSDRGFLFDAPNGVLEFEKSYAFHEPIPQFHFGDLYVDSVYTNTVLLHATTQQVVNIKCKGYGKHPAAIIGDAGSLLEVSGFGTNTVNWAGGVSLLKTGTGRLRMSKRAFSSSGDVAVTGGTLEFADGGSWTNAQNVAVGGTGTLVVSQDNTFDRGATLSLSDSGVISIADGVTVKAAALYVDGEKAPAGRYTYASAPASIRAHLDPSTTGAILIKGGFIISFR